MSALGGGPTVGRKTSSRYLSAFYANGPDRFGYQLYKDVNRQMDLHPASALPHSCHAGFTKAVE